MENSIENRFVKVIFPTNEYIYAAKPQNYAIKLTENRTNTIFYAEFSISMTTIIVIIWIPLDLANSSDVQIEKNSLSSTRFLALYWMLCHVVPAFCTFTHQWMSKCYLAMMNWRSRIVGLCHAKRKCVIASISRGMLVYQHDKFRA